MTCPLPSCRAMLYYVGLPNSKSNFRMRLFLKVVLIPFHFDKPKSIIPKVKC